jgi:hypothetical protein
MYLIYNDQFGFRSAMIALTEFVYKEINTNKMCILVALDLFHAFDVIVREFLLKKLVWYRIDPGTPPYFGLYIFPLH